MLDLLDRAAHLESVLTQLHAEDPLSSNHPRTIAENYALIAYTGFKHSKKISEAVAISLEGIRLRFACNRQNVPLTAFRMTILQITPLF
jgi:hypothetical protein